LIDDDIELRKPLHELRRRYPEAVDKPKKRSILAGAVHSPIPINAHQYMRKQHWLAAFRKYNNDRDVFGKDFLKGGITQLSSAFQDVVKQNPSPEKLDIIENVIHSKDIPLSFAINGMYGWLQSDADWTPILPLCVKLLRETESHDDPYIMSVVGNLCKIDGVQPELTRFLISKSASYVTEKKRSFDPEDKETGVNNLVGMAINTQYGSAAHYLPSVGANEVMDEVFTAIEIILSTGPVESRAAIYFRFYYLTRLHSEKSHNLFVASLDKETDPHVIAAAIQSIQFYRTQGLKPFAKPLKHLIESGLLGNEDANYLFRILYSSFLHGQESAEELLMALIKSEECSKSIVIGDIMEEYYSVEGSKEKNDRLLDFIIDMVDEEGFDDISWNFYDSGHLRLVDVMSFLKKFIHSKYFKLTDNFVEYLISQCAKYPFQSVDIFNMSLLNNKLSVDQRHNYHIDEKAVKFVVSAYESLTGSDGETKNTGQSS
jgi:hypothetical protein